ncbi:MAG: VOC family protein [FCB group bacterium]|jgi:catechol 2,3-dioxygenase-like lactoylglutathione lyase family enzyme|nr:VOC family protein [FCB group bacterium]
MLKADHIAFAVSDLDRAIRFYTEALGLRLMFRKLDEEHHEAFAFLELDGANLELLQALDENNNPIACNPAPPREPYCPHLALATPNLDDTCAILRDHNVPLLKGPLEIPNSVRWLYLADPDNNVIEFVQWL